jgi:ATP-dependent Clp protease adaptor protein ClpS
MTMPMVEQSTAELETVTTRVKFPSLYQVIILNDDYTPMEFVVDVLCTVFHMDEKTATNVMLQVHYQGKGVCGYYTRDVAETKAAQVIELARRSGHPLMCQVEGAPI